MMELDPQLSAVSDFLNVLKKPKRCKFSRREDAMLSSLVEELGTQWEIIAEKFGNRTARQCRERFQSYVCPTLASEPWTREEDKFLTLLFASVGPKWSCLAKSFQGRSPVHLRNRWLILRRRALKFFGIEPHDEPPKTDENSENMKGDEIDSQVVG
jgi:hypothetical protein